MVIIGLLCPKNIHQQKVKQAGRRHGLLAVRDYAVIGLVHLFKLTRNSAKQTDELIGDVVRLVSIMYRPILTSIAGEEAF